VTFAYFLLKTKKPYVRTRKQFMVNSNHDKKNIKKVIMNVG